MSDSSRQDTDKTLTPEQVAIAASPSEQVIVNMPVRSAMSQLSAALSSSVAAGNVAPAGVVRLPGEELLEAIESEEDIVKANNELLEGAPQSADDLEKWRRIYGQVMNKANERLKPKGIMLLVAVPEPSGLGAVFTGVDMARFEAARRSGVFAPGGEDYTVTLTLPARQRNDLMRSGREEFVRTVIGWVCDACVEQQAAYRRKAAMH